jgi:hypothetical protein
MEAKPIIVTAQSTNEELDLDDFGLFIDLLLPEGSAWFDRIKVKGLPMHFDKNGLKLFLKKRLEDSWSILEKSMGVAILRDQKFISIKDIQITEEVLEKGVDNVLPIPMETEEDEPVTGNW